MATTPKAEAPKAPASTSAPVTAPADTTQARDPYRRVRVRSKATGDILPDTVPLTWLDGRFPDLVEVPSSRKAS